MVKLTAGHSMTSGDSRRVWLIVAIALFRVNYDSRIVPLRLHCGNECNDTRSGRFTRKDGLRGAVQYGLASPAEAVNEDYTFDPRRAGGEAELTSLRLLSPRLPSRRPSVLQSAHEPGEPGRNTRNRRSTKPREVQIMAESDFTVYYDFR